MKKILTTGTLVVLSIGIIVFMGKLVVIDFLAVLSRPLILALFGKEHLVIPSTIVLTILIIILVGFLFSREFFAKFLRSVPRGVERNRSCLVMFGPEAFYIAAIIKEITFKRLSGDTKKYYILYCPSSPIPWSGLPIIFVEEKNVVLLNLSLRDIYNITASFGKNTPDVLEELRAKNTD